MDLSQILVYFRTTADEAERDDVIMASSFGVAGFGLEFSMAFFGFVAGCGLAADMSGTSNAYHTSYSCSLPNAKPQTLKMVL